MIELHNSTSNPDFSSLAGIMEHFSKVPFDQFKQELDKWFYESFKAKNIDINSLNRESGSNLPDHLKILVQQIYLEAEAMQNKRDAAM
jgi:hypothetical protein